MSDLRIRRRLKQVGAGLLLILVLWLGFFLLPSLFLGNYLRAAFVLLLAWGIVVEPRRLQVTRIDLTLDRLSLELDGLRIVQLSDLHIGSLGLTLWDFKRASAIASRADPDLVVITGDIVARNPFHGISLRDALAIRARHGVYAILGNSDQRKRQSLKEELESISIRLLVNSHAIFETRGRQTLIVGVDDPVFCKDDLGSALNEAPRNPDLLLVLSHSTDLLERSRILSEFRCPCVMLSGHTHGGQFRFPFAVRKADLTAGLSHVGNIHVYVNRGIGYVLPIRIFCPPEILVLTLRSIQHPASL